MLFASVGVMVAGNGVGNSLLGSDSLRNNALLSIVNLGTETMSICDVADVLLWGQPMIRREILTRAQDNGDRIEAQ
jgi:hypothetical protein